MANVIVVGDSKQAIYGFTGASCQSMEELQTLLHADVLPLSTCFRIKNLYIIEELQKFDASIKAPTDAYYGKPIEQYDLFEEIVDLLEPGKHAILSRTNAPLIEMYFTLLKEQIPAVIRGKDDSREILALYQEIGVGRRTLDDIIEGLLEWKDAQIKKAKNNQMKIARIDDRVSSLLAVLQNSTIGTVASNIERMFSDTPNRQVVVLSSAHKSKGLEWHGGFMLHGIWRQMKNGVHLVEQFPHPLVTQPELIRQEYNLKFVMQSRFQHEEHWFNFESSL